MALIRLRAALGWVLVLGPALCAAQQNIPPKPGSLKAAEVTSAHTGKALNLDAAKAAAVTDRRMVLLGKEQELFAGLELTAPQKARLQRNLGSLACVPSGTVVPLGSGQMLMQTRPPPGPTGASLAAPADGCLASALDAAQLATFRAHLKDQLSQRKQDVAAFERNVPPNCPLTELRYYLTVLSQI